jgi:hypothetical protein
VRSGPRPGARTSCRRRRGGVPTLRGWLSPEQSESTRTPGLLAELGVEYLCDWANDDQRYLIGRGGRPLVSLPLMQEISDVNLHWNRRVTMAQWAALVCEAFDTLYREGSTAAASSCCPCIRGVSGSRSA